MTRMRAVVNSKCIITLPRNGRNKHENIILLLLTAVKIVPVYMTLLIKVTRFGQTDKC